MQIHINNHLLILFEALSDIAFFSKAGSVTGERNNLKRQRRAISTSTYETRREVRGRLARRWRSAGVSVAAARARCV